MTSKRGWIQNSFNMADHSFGGDISGINERQLEFINKILIENKLKTDESKVIFEPVGKAGDNYVANVKRIVIEEENRIISIIVKIAPSNEMMRMAMNSFVMFQNEHVMYTEVLPKLLQLQKEADVPDDECLKFAKCYGSSAEQPNEVILLEDLRTTNYLMLDRFQSLSDACVRSVLKNFAILHSLAFVLKKKEPSAFDNVKNKLLDLWTLTAGVKEAQYYFAQLENDVLSVLDSEKHKNLVRHKITDIINIAAKLGKADEGSKYSVIQQGDSWTNNIMFRFVNDEVHSIMIDYQLSKESSPATDILYMIFNCTDHATRNKHYHDWIDYYHSELDKSLHNFGMKANFVYPKDLLDADLKRYGKLMFGLSIILASVLTRKSEEAAEFKNSMEHSNGDIEKMTDSMKVSNLGDETRDRFQQRVVGLINSFNEFGLL